MRCIQTSIPLLLLVVIASLHAQQPVLIDGTVVDAENSRPVPGATVRIESLKKGTYTSARGTFRLPLPPGRYKHGVSNRGDQEQRQEITTDAPHLSISLKPSSVSMQGIEVSAEMDADQIMRRAIGKKEENLAKLKTFQGLLYSKFNLEIAGNAFGAIKDDDRMVILETFSRNYYDSEKGIRIDIIQRRQTANIPSDQNLFAFGNFFSFYDEEIPLLNATVLSPLSHDPFSRYEFSLIGRTTLNDTTVYIIGVKPATKVLPAFEGTLKIVKGTFQLIEADLSPSKTTAISFVRDLHFFQKFEKFQDDIWQPTYLQVKGQGNVEVVKGLAEITADFTATSIFTEAQVNAPLPDTVFDNPSIIAASPTADSSRPEFWKNNALSELTPREQEIYQQVDSIVTAMDTTKPAAQFDLNISPYVDFNRVGSASLGLSVAPRIGPVRLGALGAYSFGLKKPVGNFDLTLSLLEDRSWSLALAGGIFSRLGTMSTDNTIPRFINTFTSALFHRDYSDYFRQDGWNAGIRAGVSRLRAGVTFEESRQFGEQVHTNRSIFQKVDFRPNPLIVEGSFHTLSGSITWGNPEAFAIISSSSSLDFRAKVGVMFGEKVDGSLSFNSVEGSMMTSVPTFGSGYIPMELELGASAGTGGAALPPQYQFRMPTSVSFVGRFGQFYSAPTGLYGGTSYIALHAEHNFSDILWRFIGLPLYEGRGIEFILAGSAGKFDQENSTGYLPTGKQWYTEVGFGLGKIPVFISNVAFLRFDARWGIGPLGSGNFGAVVGISSPF
jgi:hypothetical protein